MRKLMCLMVAVGVLIAAGAGAAAEEWAGDGFYAEWIGKHLRALREPFLHEPIVVGDREVFRMVALPSFDHPVSVRVNATSLKAVVRMTDGKGGYEPGNLVFERVVIVPKADLEALRAAFNRIGFWAMPTITPRREEVGADGVAKVWVCADGTLLVLEALADGRHHMVHRDCSSTDDLSSVVSVFKRIAGRHLPDHLK